MPGVTEMQLTLGLTQCSEEASRVRVKEYRQGRPVLSVASQFEWLPRVRIPVLAGSSWILRSFSTKQRQSAYSQLILSRFR